MIFDKIMVCTSNNKKLEEISFILKALNIDTLAPDKELDVEEYGNTFLSNAYIKAKAYYEFYKVPTLADDSGLEIKALDNRPGVYSSRFYQLDFGKEYLSKEELNTLSKDELNNLKVLRLLEKEKDKEARFVSSVVIYFDNKGIFGEGYLEGKIANNPSGTLGFGYDPIFIPKGYDTTLANIEHKNDISHRRKALENVVYILRHMQ